MLKLDFSHAFEVAALPRLVFGSGRIRELPQIIATYGKRCLLLTGGSSFTDGRHWPVLTTALQDNDINYWHMRVSHEPSPQLVDQAVQEFRQHGIQVVVAIGGGSVLDAAKAIAGLLPFGNSVLDHLEGVGRGIPYNGPALPYIAVPTTAGTGSEATKNAVLSVQASDGYKKSFRHESLMARVALLDPQLLQGCPSQLIAAQGMDAFTQLLESYVSLRANPFCDALAMDGLRAFKEGFWPAWDGGDTQTADAGRAAMLYAAYLSGITLAQVGLGSVHGLASPLGAFYPIPHGVVCGTLVATATEVNLRALRERDANNPAIAKYAIVGRLFTDVPQLDDYEASEALVGILASWTGQLNLPRLSNYGVEENDIERIVANSRGNSMQTNPLRLEDEEIAEIVRRRL